MVNLNPMAKKLSSIKAYKIYDQHGHSNKTSVSSSNHLHPRRLSH